MPSASSAKLEKQASSEAIEPIKQGILIVDHKIRNLVKKKGRLDTYREIQKSGKELEKDQKQSLLKYDEVCQNLAFAQDLSKQLNTIAQDAVKQQKKKEKKEAYEREQQETAKVKEILIIQDVLASMGNDTVREDFLAGRNRAVQLTETELQYLDELFTEVSPKREPEEDQPSFQEQAQNAAKHLLSIVDGKDKEIVGTKYSTLRELIEKINNSGYFDYSATQEPALQEAVEEAAPEEPPVVETLAEPEPEEIEPEPVQSATFQPSPVDPVVVPVVETAGLYISQRPMADVLTNVMGAGPTTFNFIQESELESPDVGVVAAPVPVPAALPIPSQTFTNASYVPPPPQPEVMYSAPAQYSPVPPAQPAPPQPSNTFQNTSQAGAGDWNESTEQNTDWAMQVEQSESWTEPPQQTDDWNENSNDGFQTAGGRGGGRGGRGRGGGGERGRGGPRGGRGGYQNGRGNYNNQNNRGGGGGYYNRNNNGEERNNFYQNGYQARGDGERGYRDNREGGPRRGGPRGGGGGGGQDRGPRPDRGGPRGGGGRGGSGNPRGGNRGNRQ
ncbi:caprin homolog isoform X2 [Homalodisca vitripennis]|uniref:caprin homolog isoform X2 n=1 Tax=Homalodisca vitripennis TaxID=197043 RepID=UPI001EEB0C04|nr:caprin homolog isoform X2 [Homalodisca vitripennis]